MLRWINSSCFFLLGPQECSGEGQRDCLFQTGFSFLLRFHKVLTPLCAETTWRLVPGPDQGHGPRLPLLCVGLTPFVCSCPQGDLSSCPWSQPLQLWTSLDSDYEKGCRDRRPHGPLSSHSLVLRFPPLQNGNTKSSLRRFMM